MRLRTVLGAVLAIGLTASAFAQSELKVGDQAPGLDVQKWVKGQETALESGRVYVVEFWATWCGPCRRSIPHLTKLQKEFGEDGLTIIGVSNEEPEIVEKFVKSQGAKMTYTVVVDRYNATNRAWMQAAGQRGIPAAFIVDRKGRIAFIGNPLMEEFDEALAKVMTGRFDPVLEKQARPVLLDARKARQIRNWRLASRQYDEVIKLDAAIFASVALEKFEMLLVDLGDQQQAYEYARTLMLRTFVTDAEALDMLALKIATDPKIPQDKRDLDLALEIAETAHRIAGDLDAPTLAVLAEVRFRRGELDQAIELQKQAYFNAAPRQKAEFKRVLTSYQEAGHRSAGANKAS